MPPRGDHSSFVSSVVLPKSGQRIINNIVKLDNTIIEKIVDLGVESTAGKVLRKQDYESLKKKSSLHSVEFDQIFSYVFLLLRTSIKHRTKFSPTLLKQQIVDNLQLPAQFAETFTNVVFSSEIKNISLLSTPRLNVCKYLKWRIDVLISNDCLSKIMEPVIVLEMTLENGRKLCFECKIVKFNQLRFAVASILKIINNLEERAILKPVDY